MFILALTSVIATDVVYDYYLDTNQTETFSYCGDFNSSKSAYFSTEDSLNEMVYNNDTDCYDIFLNNEDEEDIYAWVYYSNESNETYLINSTLRWRDPFYYKIKLYKENATFSVGDLKPYCNEFSYLYMISKDDSDDEWVNFETPILDDLLGFESTTVYDSPVYWNFYDDCESDIKLYETGNYTLNVVSSKVRPPKYIEFYDYRNSIRTKIDEKLISFEITDKENLTYSIYTSDYEISKMWFGLNVIKWILVVVIPAIILFVLTRPDIALRLVGK